MSNVYARVAKISNVVGRSDYISNSDRQEEIILHEKHMQYDWSVHANFEKENQKSHVRNNEALEVHLALPNELSKDGEKLKRICDELSLKIVGENKDFEYAVHWNKNRTNLHMHILFSERENNTDLEPKIYKRDIYYNFEEKKITKKSDPKAELIHKKGEIQRDKEGKIKYQTDPFKVKDSKFTESSWIHEKNRQVASVFKDHGFDIAYREKENPYLSQKKLYKGASEDYIQTVTKWNQAVQEYNDSVKKYLQKKDASYEECLSTKNEILIQAKKMNSAEKKISPETIGLVEKMKDHVMSLCVLTFNSIKRAVERLAGLGGVLGKQECGLAFVDKQKRLTNLEWNVHTGDDDQIKAALRNAIQAKADSVFIVTREECCQSNRDDLRQKIQAVYPIVEWFEADVNQKTIHAQSAEKDWKLERMVVDKTELEQRTKALLKESQIMPDILPVFKTPEAVDFYKDHALLELKGLHVYRKEDEIKGLLKAGFQLQEKPVVGILYHGSSGYITQGKLIPYTDKLSSQDLVKEILAHDEKGCILFTNHPTLYFQGGQGEPLLLKTRDGLEAFDVTLSAAYTIGQDGVIDMERKLRKRDFDLEL